MQCGMRDVHFLTMFFFCDAVHGMAALRMLYLWLFAQKLNYAQKAKHSLMGNDAVSSKWQSLNI